MVRKETIVGRRGEVTIEWKDGESTELGDYIYRHLEAGYTKQEVMQLPAVKKASGLNPIAWKARNENFLRTLDVLCKLLQPYLAG